MTALNRDTVPWRLRRPPVRLGLGALDLMGVYVGEKLGGRPVAVLSIDTVTGR